MGWVSSSRSQLSSYREGQRKVSRSRSASLFFKTLVWRLRARAAGPSSNDGSRLLSLPLELRQKIYVEVFSGAEIRYTYHMISKHTRYAAPFSVERGVIAIGSCGWFFYGRQMHVGVLRASKQVHSEARPILATAIHLIINSKITLDDVPRCIRQHYLPRIEKLTVTDTYYSNLPRINTTRLPKLKTLTLIKFWHGLSALDIKLTHGSALEEASSILLGRKDNEYIDLFLDSMANWRTKRFPGSSLWHTVLSDCSPSSSCLKVRIRWDCYLKFHVRQEQNGSYLRQARLMLEFDPDTREVFSRSVAGDLAKYYPSTESFESAGDVSRWLLGQMKP